MKFLKLKTTFKTDFSFTLYKAKKKQLMVSSGKVEMDGVRKKRKMTHFSNEKLKSGTKVK